jgi:hypothetical protein
LIIKIAVGPLLKNRKMRILLLPWRSLILKRIINLQIYRDSKVGIITAVFKKKKREKIRNKRRNLKEN